MQKVKLPYRFTEFTSHLRGRPGALAPRRHLRGRHVENQRCRLRVGPVELHLAGPAGPAGPAHGRHMAIMAIMAPLQNGTR